MRDITKMETIWQGDPISSVKTFKNLNCPLCTRERVEIHKAMKLNKKNKTNFLVNSSNELCGGCRHNPRCHRFCAVCPQNADEAIAAEKLKDSQKTSSVVPRNDKQVCFSAFFWKNNQNLVTPMDTTFTS